jgi:hypothetical protein
VALIIYGRMVQLFSSLGPRIVHPLDTRAKKLLLVSFFKANTQFSSYLTILILRNDKLPWYMLKYKGREDAETFSFLHGSNQTKPSRNVQSVPLNVEPNTTAAAVASELPGNDLVRTQKIAVAC